MGEGSTHLEVADSGITVMDDLRQRLLSQIERVPGPLSTDCWIFQTSTGHVHLNWKDRSHRAARFSYLAFVVAIKDGYYICHKCDRPACINPDHLFEGTPQDNVQDCIAKGRWRRA